MTTTGVQLEALNESKVQAILKRDAKISAEHGASSFWNAFYESLGGDKDFKNTVFLHTAKSIEYAAKSGLTEATTTANVSTYNKALLPTIIARVFPQIVATKFIATRQLDMPTQVLQTFRLTRLNAKNGVAANKEFMDPAGYAKYGTTDAWQSSKTVLDPNYTSQMVSGEAITSGSTVSTAYGPITPGSIAIYEVSDTDPRIRTLKGIDPGVTGSPFLDATGTPITGTSVISYGVLNSTAPSMDIDTITPAAQKHLEIEYSYQLERNTTGLSEIGFKHDLIHTSVRSRKAFAQISAEALQDLEAYSEGRLDGLKELVNGMTQSMALEIDQELTAAMLGYAKKSVDYDNAYASNTFRGTRFEKNQELVHRMNYIANELSVDFFRGQNMFAICHPHVFTILQNTNEFRMLDTSHEHQGNFDVAAEKLGSVSGFTVAKAPLMPQSDTVLLGYMSKDLANAAYAYFPYVTYLTPPMPDVKSGDIFSTVVGLQQRYDHRLMLDGEYGLGTVKVKNLYSTTY